MGDQCWEKGILDLLLSFVGQNLTIGNAWKLVKVCLCVCVCVCVLSQGKLSFHGIVVFGKAWEALAAAALSSLLVSC